MGLLRILQSDNQQDQLEFKDRGENALGDRRTRMFPAKNIFGRKTRLKTSCSLDKILMVGLFS